MTEAPTAPTTTQVTSVRVEPAGADLHVRAGETLFEAAIRAGWKWPTICQGIMECGVCHVFVEAGADRLTAPTPAERDRLASNPAAAKEPSARLACQIKPHAAGLVVRRRGARPGA
jgi:ferredoxin